MAKKGEGSPVPAEKTTAAADKTTPKAATPVVEELPRTIVRRVVKEKLADLSSSGEGEMVVHKDALLAFAESTRVFIHYISATANDICKESKRQTINADDVFKALEEIEFPEFIEPLKASLEEYRKKNAVKKSTSKVKNSDKKRKLEEHTSNENGGNDAVENTDDEQQEAQDEE